MIVQAQITGCAAGGRQSTSSWIFLTSTATGSIDKRASQTYLPIPGQYTQRIEYIITHFRYASVFCALPQKGVSEDNLW
jgi:hypothetical protein